MASAGSGSGGSRGTPSAASAHTAHAQSSGPDGELDLDGWEEWNGQGSFLHHCVAGSMAGVSEHVLMFPFDTYKVRSGGVGRWRRVIGAEDEWEAAAEEGTRRRSSRGRWAVAETVAAPRPPPPP